MCVRHIHLLALNYTVIAEVHLMELAVIVNNGLLHFLHVTDDFMKLKEIDRQLFDLRSTITPTTQH